MKILKNFLNLLVFVLLIGCQENSRKIYIISDNWEFKNASSESWYPAIVPGNIHTDLFNNNLIIDPFAGKNEKSLQWIDTCDWIYQTSFNKPKDLKKGDHVEMIFEGLDTYADIYLNDSVLFSANNMFIPWIKEIEANKLKEKNKLTVVFKSTLKEERKKINSLPYDLPGGSRVFTRKAAYQYGWDWAPTYVSGGIWQNVKLHRWNTAIIRNIQTKIETINSEKALISLHIEIESDSEFVGALRIDGKNQKIKKTFNDISIKKGTHLYDLQFEIENAKLWWIHNLGEPYLYKFNIDLRNKNKLIDSQHFKLGLRTIELIRAKDDAGKSFYFKLNGVPVFMKGANYVPQSSFPGKVKDSDYRKLLSDAKKANMNMLRVWGGGIYEKDIFYDLCDSAGILIWQDFMFANAMYPGDSTFLENVNNEANYQVKRLSKHPSLAVWCGNNEMDEAWHNWGWSGNYSKADSATIWNNYQSLFHSILPGIVKKSSPEIPYTTSSPTFGRGNPRSSYEGDNHYWYVWHDGYDFDWYNKVTGRFMSEFGFQSFPSLQTIEYFDTSSIKKIDSEIMLSHQKHPNGNSKIKQYMDDYYTVPDDFDDFVYVSQLLQAEGIRTGILAQRRAKPFCMGSLFWQLNDCWPAISWSSIDYNGKWKALHYFASQDFQNIILSPHLQNDTLRIYSVSDSLDSFNAELLLQLIDFKGSLLNKQKINCIINKNTSQQIVEINVNDLLGNKSRNNHLLYLELISDNKILTNRIVYFAKPKDIRLIEPDFSYQINKTDKGYEVTFTSSNLVKNLYIDLPADYSLSDNYFDLIPGRSKKIEVKCKNPKIEFSNDLKYNCLNYLLVKKNPTQ
ncbi:MAG: glycoside hydrolase family 2 protein [Bacteroidales bacterium]